MLSVSFILIPATQKLKLNLARDDTVVRHMEIPRRAQYFSAMIRRVSNLYSGDIQQRENLSLVKFSNTIIGIYSLQLACNFKVLKKWNKQFETTEGNKQCISWLQL
ncbi:Hypothetical_protein [Hexamita inflata]|uniref:Hypothetical_protein n=1 Tax=Hexamita inflata TaxID=28002 RepID=A0AA86R4S4_9EUKA|nr:Hypothetical protein HINF_LOCUS56982 [Hexamita inflata]